MGGSLYGAERMPRDKFLLLLMKFIPELRTCLWETEFKPVPYYSEKEDFGDLDVIVKANTDVVRAAIIKHFGFIPEDSKLDHRHQYTTNANVFSFIYEKFQIDLICTIEDYDTSIAYYSFNDVGNILGRFYHKLGLKFGHKGLLYPLRDDNGNLKEEILITRDTKKIIEFLGLDFEKWNKGFTTLEDIFTWVSTGMYFDPTIFMGELSAINEKRDRKRKTFSKFLDWVEETKPEQKYVFSSREERANYIPAIEEYFKCDLVHKIKEFEFEQDRKKQVNAKFNGDIVMEVTGLKGKELGEFIGLYKASLSNEHTFEEYIIMMKPEDIRRDIDDLYLEFRRV